MIDAQTVKAHNPIEDVAREWYSLTFDERGRGRCYFHQQHNNGDADPSLRLNREKQTIFCESQKCFGDKPQDIFSMVQAIEGIDFKAALNKLAKRAGLNGRSEVDTPKPEIVAEYDYCDEEGNLLFQVVRQEPGPKGEGKTFKIRRPDGKGGWIWKTKGMHWIPYRLPELLASSGPVIIPEGEKRRIKAGSNLRDDCRRASSSVVSTSKFVAANTKTGRSGDSPVKPSISVSSFLSACSEPCALLQPDRIFPIASISSMKMMEGA